MTSVQYQQQIDEEDEEEELTRTEIVFQQMTARGQRWPLAIGVVEIVIGVILGILGVLEIFVVPFIDSKDGENLIEFSKRNCYGAGLLAGLVMVVTGSTAVRATLSQRNTTVYRFFNLTILSMTIYMALTIFLIVGYAKGWNASNQYQPGSKLREVHIFLTIFTVMGLLFALSSFVQYFDIICCSEFPLWQQWVKCFCPCVYTKRPQRQIFDNVTAEEYSIRNCPI